MVCQAQHLAYALQGIEGPLRSCSISSAEEHEPSRKVAALESDLLLTGQQHAQSDYCSHGAQQNSTLPAAQCSPRTLSSVSDDSSVIWSSGASLQSSSAQHTPAIPPPTTTYFMLVVSVQSQFKPYHHGAVNKLPTPALKLYRHRHWIHCQKLVSRRPSCCSFPSECNWQ